MIIIRACKVWSYVNGKSNHVIILVFYFPNETTATGIIRRHGIGVLSISTGLAGTGPCAFAAFSLL